MDSSVSAKDGICFLRVCHHIANAVYQVTLYFRVTFEPSASFHKDGLTMALLSAGTRNHTANANKCVSQITELCWTELQYFQSCSRKLAISPLDIQGVPLATEPGISSIILPLMRILLLRVATIRRTTDTFHFISHTTNVILFKFRCNIFIAGFGSEWDTLY